LRAIFLPCQAFAETGTVGGPRSLY